MPRPRTPLDKARATGQDQKNKGRYSARSEPEGLKPLGEPSEFMNEAEAGVWEGFKKEFPWLKESDRCLLEIACKLRGTMISGGGLNISALAQLRMCISSMGGSPSDITKITIPNGEKEDPAAKFFN
ncbi:hypothetical protein [Kiloniella antarctica]|uniref:Uncharacterized protein n=1 Tax=Kiloniella antarctica TaxID=1550907 RepID=A0ABW5BKE1_9PROT